MTHTTQIKSITEVAPYSFDETARIKFRRMTFMVFAMITNNMLACSLEDEAYRATVREGVDEWNKAVRAGMICC